MCEELIPCISSYYSGKKCQNYILPETPGTDVIKALVKAMLDDRAKAGKRITVNELESLFYSLDSLALGSVFNNCYNMGCMEIDTLYCEIEEKDDFNKTTRIFSQVHRECIWVEDLMSDVWSCFSDLIFQKSPDWDWRDSKLSECLEDVCVFAYKGFYGFYHKKLC